MQLNGRGFTAVVDAAFFVMLIGIASVIIVNTVDGTADEPESEAPSEFLDSMFDGKLHYSDMGIDSSTESPAPMPRIAYVSVTSEEGAFLEYARKMLDETYPWQNSYLMTISCSKWNVDIGTGGGDAWRSCTKVYGTGYSENLTVTLSVYH